MRKLQALPILTLLSLFSAGCGGTAYRADVGAMPKPAMNANTAGKGVAQGMGDKIVRGFVNTLTGWMEWPVQTYKGYQDGIGAVKSPAASKTLGTLNGLLLRGPGHALGRTGSGLLELAGFWAANPESNDGVGVPLDAPQAWEDGTRFSLFKEGLAPWGRKIARGAGNGIGGILELPGQIKKGAQNGSVGTGILKGFWYFPSRTLYGIGEVFTFLVPNPKDQVGHAFEEERPWDALSK